jgi:hypothetical protein
LVIRYLIQTEHFQESLPNNGRLAVYYNFENEIQILNAALAVVDLKAVLLFVVDLKVDLNVRCLFKRKM